MRNYLQLRVRLAGLLAVLWSYAVTLPAQELASVSTPVMDYETMEQDNAQPKTQSLKKALDQLQTEYQVYFTYDAALVKDHTVAEADKLLGEQPIEEVLSAYLKPLKLKFKKTGEQYYVIYREEQAKKVRKLSGLDPRTKSTPQQPWLSSTVVEKINPAPVRVMEQTISGTVTDAEEGDGLPGVNILAKGTSIGTISDVEGNYRLSVPDETTTLVFSSVGYETQEIDIEGRSTIDVRMAPDVQALSEVVVVGYGEQKKVTVTGSVASVDGEELVQSPALNVSNSIAGRIPGVFAVQRSGEPGYDGSGIRIRGTNTLGNNDALIVIDGVPARAGGLERLNPANIESISVLKDASAAIYGSRAANGVILITTKRGQTGKPQLSYSFNQGWAQPTVIPDMAEATQFAQMRNELEIYNLPVDEWDDAQSAFNESGSYTRPNGSVLEAPYTPEEFELLRNGTDPWGYPNTDWFDETLKTWSPQSRHNLQITGGSENFKYLASLGYQNQDAYYKDAATGYKQYDLRINLDADINEYIKTRIGIMGRQERRFFPTQSAESIFRMLMRGIPTSPAYWPNGLPGPDIENGQNPVVITTNETGYDRDTQNYIQTNGTVDFTIPGVEGLTISGTAAVDKRIRQLKAWRTPWFLYTWDGVSIDDETGDPLLVPGKRGFAEPQLAQGNEDQLNILLGGTVTYQKAFGDHNFTVLAGVNHETIEFSSFNAFRRYFISPAIDQLFAGGEAEQNNGGTAWERARLSYFGRVGYNFQEKYLAEFLWRYDASYMFPEDTRWGFFPGVSAGWVVSEENFWKDNITFMDFFKLRGSWGQMGNDNIYYDANRNGTIDGDEPLMEYQYLATYGFNSYIIGGQEVTTLSETRVPNNAITWEVANNANFGIEGQMFQGKVFFEFDYFINKRTNILWPKYGSVPQTTGMTLPPENIGEVENRGYDFNVGYNGQFGDLSFNVSVNGGYAKNKIIFWDEAPGVPEWQQTEGSPMYTFLLYEYDGVFRDQAEIDANTLDYSELTNTLRPGDMKYKDLYGPDGVPDGKITADDRILTDKNHIPLFQGGLNMGARYGNFDLTILFQGATGAVTFVDTDTESGSIGNYLEEQYYDRWSIENPSSEHPRISDRDNQWYSDGNSYALRSTNYVRLKNFEVGYTLPLDLTERVGISNLRVYANGLNLFTIDALDVFDPETTNALGRNYPQSRIINLGATVTF